LQTVLNCESWILWNHRAAIICVIS